MKALGFALVAVVAACERSEAPLPGATTPAAVNTGMTAGTASAAATTPPASPAPAPVITLPSGPSLYDLETPLEDQNARRLTLRALTPSGGTLLIAMFYARCSYACPTLIADLQRLDAALTPAARARTRVVLVTLLPDRDDPTTLAELARQHHLDGARWVLARAPDDDTTRDLANALGIKYTRLSDGNVNHTSAVTLVDADGVPRARLEGLRQDARDFAARVERGR